MISLSVVRQDLTPIRAQFIRGNSLTLISLSLKDRDFPSEVPHQKAPQCQQLWSSPRAMGSITLPLQTGGQHWLTSSLRKAIAAPSLALGVRCQPPALEPSPSKKKESSFVLRPQSWCIHTMTIKKGNKKPQRISKGWNEVCTFLHGLLDRGILLCISLL